MADKSTDLDPGMVARISEGSKVRYKVSDVKPGGWFTPLQPLNPVAQDAAHGRQFDYPVGYNTRIRPKDDAAVTYQELRALADNLDVLRLVIETRKDQIESFDWEVIAKKGRKVSDADLNKVRKALDNPTREYEWATWLRMILEEVFVIDAVAILPRKTRGGELYSLDLVDGSTIKRVIDDGGRTPIAPDPAYQQILKGVPATDYTADELIYSMRNPRVSKIYGFSPVEQIVMTINIALRRQLTQLQYYTEGNIPEALVGVPKEWNPDQVKQFQMYFDSIMQGNTASRSRLKFLPLDVNNIHETKDTAMKDVFDEWLARVVCYAFSVSSAPFITSNNRATAESAQDASESEGLAPTLAYIKRLVDNIIVRYIGVNDVEFKWCSKKAVKPLEQAQIDKIYVDSQIKDVNEVRLELGLAEKEIVKVEPVDQVKEEAKKFDHSEGISEGLNEDLIKVLSKSLDIHQESNDSMARLAKNSINSIANLPAPVVHFTTGETIVHANITAPLQPVTKKITATRNPDGTMTANVDSE